MHPPQPSRRSHRDASPFPEPGSDFPSLRLDVTEEANDRYWRGAGIEHPARAARLLYPPMAVNFTILLVQQAVPFGLLHTWGRIRCHATATAPNSLTVTGTVSERFTKRERDYFGVSSEVRADDGSVLWSADLELASSQKRTGASDSPGPTRPTYTLSEENDPRTERKTRAMTLSADLLRTYSRAGNFHSDDAAAAEMGLPGMVAMGMQTVGPVWGLVLDEWGAGCLAEAEFEARFFGLVLEGDTIEAAVASADDRAGFAVRNVTKGLGTAAGSVVCPSTGEPNPSAV